MLCQERAHIAGGRRKGDFPHAALAQCQNVVDHIHHGGRRRDIRRYSLRRGNTCLGAAQLRGKLVIIQKHLRVELADGLINRPPSGTDAADDLAGKLGVSAVDVDQFFRFTEGFVAQLPAAIVVHGADKA